MNNVIISCGDINGIGPEISLKSIDKSSSTRDTFIFICPKNVFEKSAQLVNFNKKFFAATTADEIYKSKKKIKILLLNNAKMNVRIPTRNSGLIAFSALDSARNLIVNYGYKILVTAPISKQSFNLAGINFPGHTELIASWFNTNNFLMTFISKKFKAALFTIHVPIKSVPKLMNVNSLTLKLKIFSESLIHDFGYEKPKIAVLGLNPHAGESGNIGDEESKIITPALQKFKKDKIHGPLVADAFFANHEYKKYDGVFGMYHDQILIPFKMLNFNNGVNFTAGLPIIRTSPDHGTAFDIAWENIADESSMLNAIRVALSVNKQREKSARH